MVNFEHQVFNDFIRREWGRWSDDTVKTRQSGLVKFEEYLLERNIEIDDVSKKDIDNFLNHMNSAKKHGGEGLTDLTASIYITAVRKFYNWHYLDEEDKTNPCDDLDTDHLNFKAEYDKITLNEDELRALVDSAPTKRSKALVALMAGTGMRLQEACTLEKDQVILKERKVKEVETLKRDDGHERTVYFDRRTRMVLKNYINTTRAKYGESDYLFIARNVNNKESKKKDTPLSVDRARTDFNEAVENCEEMEKYLDVNIQANGVERSTITSHICRRSFCQIFVNNGGDLMSLKNIAGWKTIETAKNYLDGDNDLDTRDKYGVQL